MADDGHVRHVAARVHASERSGQQAIARECEQDARAAEQLDAHEAEHRQRRAREHQQAQRRADPAHRVGKRHRGCGERRTEDALRNDLDRNVQQRHDQHGQHQRARDGARRLPHLAAGGKRGLHAGEREQREDQRAPQARSAEFHGLPEILTMNGGRADDHEDRQRKQFQQGGRTDQAHTARHAAEVYPGDAGYDDDDDQHVHRRLERLGQQVYRNVGERRRHATAGEDVAEPGEHTGDAAGQRPEGRGHVSVAAAAAGNAAATLGKADGHRAHRECAHQQCQRRVGTDARRERTRHREDARAHGVADGAGRQGPGPDGAQQPGVAIPYLHAATVPSRRRRSNNQISPRRANNPM